MSHSPFTLPHLGRISDEYFYRMLSNEGIRLSAPFHLEEERALRSALSAHADQRSTVLAIGSGELWALRLALQHAGAYLCVEPLLDLHINDSVRYLVEQNPRVRLLGKLFSQLQQEDLPEGPAFYLFFFNVLAYISHPLEHLNRLLRPGDTLFISTWADTERAREVCAGYFHYLNQHVAEQVSPPRLEETRCQLSRLPVWELRHYHAHQLIPGEVAEVLVVETEARG